VSVVLVVFGFLATIILSSVIILNSWIKFADNQIDRRENRISQQKFINNLSNQIKQLNKNIALQKKSKNNNVIIDVECEIVEESNTQAKYLYLDNNH
jgi:predicted PurR-regulated permease PerM